VSVGKYIDWKRYWAKRGSEVRLVEGFLADPEASALLPNNPWVVLFSEIASTPCLALLGEPGIGKTSWLEMEMPLAEKAAAERGDRVMHVDLGEVGSETGLVDEVFRNDRFKAWQAGTASLGLFLDSLDECRLSVHSVSSILLRELKKLAAKEVGRLRLRVVCRAAEWPEHLEEGLINLWGEKNVAAYVLQPLTVRNVWQAAETEEVDPHAFWRAITESEAAPFAGKPVTLFFLLDLYKAEGGLPRSQSELYLKGCRRLCEELSPSRRAAGRMGDLDADQRLAIASRIAAVTVFCGCAAVWTGDGSGLVPHEDVPVSSVTGGVESTKGNEIPVYEAAVREVLETALFNSRGLNRLGFAHQTYAEFLAARYLKEHNATIDQILSLVTHPGDEQMQIVPQLREVAAWIAGMSSDAFRAIMKNDPQVLLLLGSGIATVEDQERAAPVAELLRQLAEEKISDRDWSLRPSYHKLRHPGIAGQLVPYIRDSNMGIMVRRAAIHIADACQAKELQDLLVDIVLDIAQPIQVREHAAWAVTRIADAETRLRLRPLLQTGPDEDPRDELKGCALMGLWPDHLTAQDLFEVIVPKKDPDFYGPYDSFLHGKLIPNLKVHDLAVALRWTEQQPSLFHIQFALRDLVEDIFRAAWQNLNEPGVLPALASAIIERCKHLDHFLESRTGKRQEESVFADEGKRRSLIQAIVAQVPDGEERNVSFHLARKVVLSADFSWMLSELAASQDSNMRRKWPHFIGWVLDRDDPQQFDAIASAARAIPELREHFKWLLGPIALNSPEAENARRDYKAACEISKMLERPLLDPPPSERIRISLERFESGKIDAWWWLNREMTLEPNSTHYGNELESDLTVLPGWKDANDETRIRIVQSARTYLLKGDPHSEEWLGTDHGDYRAWAGYRALRLLLTLGHLGENDLASEVWKKWAPIVLAYPVEAGAGQDDPHQTLVKLTYQHVPEEITETLNVLIDKDNRRGDTIFIIRKMALCWDDRLCRAMLAKAQSEDLKPSCMGDLLEPLVEHGMQEAVSLAGSLLSVPLPADKLARDRACIAGDILMTKAPVAGWQAVWPAIQSDDQFGRQLLLRAACGMPPRQAFGALSQQLTEDQIADLYIWLERQFPGDQDPKQDGNGMHLVTARDEVAELRDRLLGRLQSRGTPDALMAIRRIQSELPHPNSLKWVVQDAHRVLLVRTWNPPQPADLLRLLDAPCNRLVESGEQLLYAIIESLKRLQHRLQQHTPRVRCYWDKVPGKELYRPVEENVLSDFVKTHLEDDLVARGVIVNREVEIRRPSSHGVGERTDIHVDAVVHAPRKDQLDRVTVVIECKGCWHRELHTAMESQLRDKYLREESARHGLYLVGCFDCDKWDPEDSRQPCRMAIAEARSRFDEQAAGLSKNGFQIKAVVLDVSLP